MNKRYMDFVPKNKQPAAKSVTVKKPVPVAEELEFVAETETIEERVVEPVAKKPAPKPALKPTSVEEDISLENYLSVEDSKTHARRMARQNEPEFGVIEEYHPKFVQTEVKKRPLGRPEVKPAPKATSREELAEIKSRKLLRKPVSKTTPVSKPVEKKPVAKETLSVPKTKFVNTEKVEKRPLSKNVYKKKVPEPVEEPTGPVTIITKPDKGSHIGIIVTIILTIILGAAAGTVAFLLLPK